MAELAFRALNQFFLCGKILPYWGEKELKRIFCPKFHFLVEKVTKKNPKNHPKFSPAYNMKGTLRLFLLSYFEYCQIWLNVLIEDIYNPWVLTFNTSTLQGAHEHLQIYFCVRCCDNGRSLKQIKKPANVELML